jgi:hypothetical protein
MAKTGTVWDKHPKYKWKKKDWNIIEKKVKLTKKELTRLLTNGIVTKDKIQISCTTKPVEVLSKIYGTIKKLTESRNIMELLYGHQPKMQVNIGDLEPKKKRGRKNARK